MPTARFCELFGIPERTWRRWQAKARVEQPPRGPWPRPQRDRHRGVVVAIATAHPAWGHRKVWAVARHQGHRLTQSTVLRILDDAGLLLKADYQRERRRLTQRRRAAFCDPPTGPNQVWQFDFSEFETIAGGTWRVAGIADYWSKYEFGWHWSPTANQYDAIDGVELAITEAEALLGHPLRSLCRVDTDTGELLPAVTVVTDNGGPFRSFRFEAFITSRPELRHVRTKVKSPGQNGVRERAFGSLKYERLDLEEIGDHLELVAAADDYRLEFNKIRPHESLAWNMPYDVHTGLADPTIPNFERPQILPNS